MGYCLSKNEQVYTAHISIQKGGNFSGERQTSTQEAVIDVETIGTESEDGTNVSGMNWLVPRSEREPWKSYLNRDYWNEITLGKRHEDPNEDYLRNLVSFAKGDYCTLPVEKSKLFAIFVSSTFTDTEEERNLLIEDVQPYFRDLCSLFGYEFRFCEMRWGVREEASEDHQTVSLCMQELSRCQKESCGINFITFLCDKYGYCPFPSHIQEREFEELLSYVTEDKNKALLLKWFKKDENLLIPEYILQKVSLVISEYNDDDGAKRNQARNQWWSDFEVMQVALKSAASKLVNTDRQKYYEVSVTEQEILKGLLETDHPEKTAFMIKRNIRGIEERCEEQGASKFIDIDWSTNGVNQEARERLLLLKNEKLPNVLSKQSIKCYDVEWSSNGIKRDSHEKYLQDVTDTICRQVFDSCKDCFMQRNIMFNVKDSIEFRLEKELRQSMMHMTKLTKSAVPRDKILSAIDSYLFSETSSSFDQSSPLVITGNPGSGKSTIMSLSIKNAMAELRSHDDANLIFRFIGTTPDSGETVDLLSSLLHQFSIVNGTTMPSDSKIDSIELLAKQFKCKVKEEKQRTIIFLDALDQLSDVDAITEMEWLPTSLPQNVRVVISCTPSRSSMPSVYFQYLSSLISTHNFVSVTQLEADTCEKMLIKWLENDERTLSHIQMEVLVNACTKCPLPLFLKIAYGATKTWRSYDDVTDHPLISARCIADLVTHFYDKLAVAHGRLLLERSLAYLTAAKDGLSRQELEDILSCDDDVLDDIFQWWVPPIRRIPQLQVVRLLSDLEDYLTETDSFSNGVPLLRWFHRQFKETTLIMVEKALFMEDIHRHMANYFGGNWAQRGKLYVDKRDGHKEVLADRKLPRSLLVIQGKLIKSKKEADNDMSFVTGSSCKLNFRRLNEHCYHLINGGMLENAANVLCSLEYIHAKMQESRFNGLLEEFSMLLNKLQTHDSKVALRKVEEFSSFVLQRGHVMKQFPSLTYQEAANYPGGNSVRDCYETLLEKPSFILQSALQSSNGFLVSVIKGHNDSIISACPQGTYKFEHSALLATGALDGRIKIWFYRSGLEKGNFKVHSKGVNCIDFIDNSLLSISSDGRMVLWDADAFVEQLVFTASDNSELIISGNCCRFANDLKWMLSAWDDGKVRVGDLKGNWILESEMRHYPVTCLNMIGFEEFFAGFADGMVMSYKLCSSPANAPEFGLVHDLGTTDELVEVFDVLYHKDVYIIIGKQKMIRTQYSEDSNSAWAKNRFKNDPFVQKLVDEGIELNEAIEKKMENDMSSIGSFVMLRNQDGTFTKYVLQGLPTPHEYVCADLKFPYLVTGGSNGSVRLWRINCAANSNELSVLLLKELGSHSLEVNRVCFVSNGFLIVSVSDDADIKLWNTKSVADDVSYSRVSHTSYKITGCSNRGSFVVTWGRRGLVSAWRGDELLWTKICCSGEDITSAAVAPKGLKIMVGAQNYYELLNGESGSTYDVKRSCVGRRVRLCDFSKDGTTALLGDDCNIRLVTVEPEMEPLGFNDVTWKAHDDHVNYAQFCSHHCYIASGSIDGSIKMWNTSRDCCFVVRIGFPVISFFFVSSCNKLACILDDGGSFDSQVSCQQYVYNESTSSCLSSKLGEETLKETGLPSQNHLLEQSSSRREEQSNQLQGADEGTEKWHLPQLQDNLSGNEDAFPPMMSDFTATDPFNAFEMPPMSEEMLKNLEGLQAMLMSAPDASEYSPPQLPVHQPGPHRLCKKQRRQIQYVDREEVRTTTVTLLDIKRDESMDCQVILKLSKPSLNKCILSRDSKTLYSSSNIGQIFVWRNLGGKWYEIAMYVEEDGVFVAELGDSQILAASKYHIRTLDVISN